MSPRHTDARRKATVTHRSHAAAGKLMRLPRGELQHAGDQDNQTNRHRNGTRQRRQFYLERREGHPSQERRRDAGPSLSRHAHPEQAGRVIATSLVGS
jgi:hypothetical protein